ncbi:GIY-YIG nuclease family protein [Marinobacterium sp. OS208]|nr:GIY-YIG nuclease family protein [Marinobacterium sedimentorum]MCP8688627.1 GIY-YIG nuclease family protein [Marinobacterium sedimentorum]
MKEDVVLSESCWFVYILACADGSLYTGVTTDPQRRLREHNGDNRLGARYTRARRPVELLWHEQLDGRAEALRREWQIKRMPRRRKLELIAG